jgi:hypothetical protein
MARRSSSVRFVLLALGTCSLVVAPTSVSAQLSVPPALTNSSNTGEAVAGTASTASRERQSLVELPSSPTGSFFTTRYTSVVTTDSDGAGAGAGVESMSSDYQIDFTATAPGAYVLTVSTSVAGDLHLVNDGSSATADVGPITGTSSGGTVVTGSLDIADPGIIGGTGGGSIPMTDTSNATIFGVSNGAPVAHNLHFVFLQFVTSAAAGGDEAAIRLGLNSSIGTETAGDYPGSPARTQSDDGHVVTVTFTSLCGNSVIDSGPSYTEQCDEGANNGQPGSCCTTTCQFVTDGNSCTDNDVCTTGDVCQSGVCVSGSPQVCPLCQTCTPSGCAEGPRPTCRQSTQPLQAKLQIKDKAPNTNSNSIQFKWNKGEATGVADFGSPTTLGGDDYALCIFGPSGNVVKKLDAPAGGNCNGTTLCWKTLGIKGFSYKDPQRSPTGTDKLLLKAGVQGKAKTQVKGKGPLMGTLPLPLPTPATVQIQGENGACFEGVFSSFGQQLNTGTQFKGKSDAPN